MHYLYRYLSALSIFALCGVYAWMYGGSRTSVLMPVLPWVWGLMLEVCLCFPQRHHYESSLDARARMWKGLRKDPLLWVLFILFVVMIFPFFNVGLCPLCDRAKIAAGALANPPIPFAPFCVSMRDHYGMFLLLFPPLTALLLARHALLGSGRRALMEAFMWNGAMLAIFGFIERGTGALAPWWDKPVGVGVDFFSTFGYPNMAGAFFAFTFALAIGLWRQRVRDVANHPIRDEAKAGGPRAETALRRFIAAHYPLLCAVLCFFAALCTYSRAAIILVVTYAVLAGVLSILEMITSHRNRAQNIRGAAVALLLMIGFTIAVYIFAPEQIGREIHTVSTIGTLDRVSGKGQYHSHVAITMLRDKPLFGVGGGGYKHLGASYMTRQELKSIQGVGGTNVHNDFLQFFVEYGLVGGICIVLAVLMALMPLAHKWREVCHTARFLKGRAAPPRPVTLFAPPPPALWVFIGSIGLIIHSFGDCPLRSGAVMALFLIAHPAAEGFFPARDK